MQPDPLIGKTLGKYRVLDMVGKGGMAAVYRAEDPSLHRVVAIKVLPGPRALDEQFVTRFRREADILGKLVHPNIIPVYDFGEEGDLLYIVTAFVPGGTLTQRIAAGLSIPDGIEIVAKLADGLAYAHRSGIVHRDMKPSNVLMYQPDWPWITDFGIASLFEEAVAGQAPVDRLTRPGMSIGTPDYMSPEQVRGDRVDATSDLYSLAVILYEVVTGQVPFHGENAFAVMTQHLVKPVPPPSVLRPELGPQFDRLIARAMAKDPRDRFPDAPSFKDAVLAAYRDIQANVATGATSYGTALPQQYTGVSSHQSTAETAMPPTGGQGGPPSVAPARRSNTGAMLAGIAAIALLSLVCLGLGIAGYGFSQGWALPTASVLSTTAPPVPPSPTVAISQAPTPVTPAPPTEVPVVSAQGSVPSFPIKVGDDAAVTGTSSCLNVREQPGGTARVVTCLRDGARVKVTGGPQLIDEKPWWEVESTAPAAKGWAAGEFLGPASAAPSPTERPALLAGDDVIVSGTGPGSCLRVRDKPSLAGALKECLADGTRGKLASGPVSADNVVWWEWQGKGWVSAEFVRRVTP